MAYLNANIPVIECYVRGNFLRDQKDSHDKYFEVGVFGFSSIPNRVPMFHFLMEDGGLWWRAPISAFCSKPGGAVIKSCSLFTQPAVKINIIKYFILVLQPLLMQ